MNRSSATRLFSALATLGVAVAWGALLPRCTWGNYDGSYDGGPVSQGFGRSCGTESDCPPGQRCVVSGGDQGGASPPFACVTSEPCNYNPGCKGTNSCGCFGMAICAPDGQCRTQCSTGGTNAIPTHCAQGQICRPDPTNTGECYGTDPTHDPGAGAGGTTSDVIPPNPGGQVTSDDGLFTVTFPSGSLNVSTRVSIIRNLDPTGLPTFCLSKSVSCFSSAYAMTLTADPSGGPSAQLTGTIEVNFNLTRSGFGVPQQETFIVKPGPQAMPGVWADTSGDVIGLQPEESSSSLLGPYAIVHAAGAISSSSACGSAPASEVCDPCAQNCCSNPTSRFAPPHSAGIHEACVCVGASPSLDQCLGKCVGASNPRAETCP